MSGSSQRRDPYTIRIFVPDGNPEGVRIVDKLNWTGMGIAFPRSRWNEVRLRPQLASPGVYVLVGDDDNEEELPVLYIGETDGVVARLDQHVIAKDFWMWGIVFVSTNGALNKAHVQYLEYALVREAKAVGRCRLENANTPRAPSLSESDIADCEGFLREIVQILPLVGVRVFERPRPVAVPGEDQGTGPKQVDSAGPDVGIDTIIVPARKEGFERVFIGEHQWWAVRIGGGMLPKIRWIAAYQAAPVSAITHIAPVDRIEPYGDGSKYRLVFSAPASPIGPIPFGDAAQGTMQGPRYTSIDRLREATDLKELLGPVAP